MDHVIVIDLIIIDSHWLALLSIDYRDANVIEYRDMIDYSG